MKELSKTNCINMNEVSRFLIYFSLVLLTTLEKRRLLKHSQKKEDDRSKFTEFTDPSVTKIQESVKHLLKAEQSFLPISEDNKECFVQYL